MSNRPIPEKFCNSSNSPPLQPLVARDLDLVLDLLVKGTDGVEHPLDRVLEQLRLLELHGQVSGAVAALREATDTWVNATHRGIAKPLPPRPPRRLEDTGNMLKARYRS